MARTVKRARNYGLLSHLGQSVLIDTYPTQKTTLYHSNANPKDGVMNGAKGLKITKTMD